MVFQRFTLGYYWRYNVLLGVIVLITCWALRGYFPGNSNAIETLLKSNVTSNSNIRPHPYLQDKQQILDACHAHKDLTLYSFILNSICKAATYIKTRQLCKLLLFMESSLQGLHDMLNVDTCQRMDEIRTLGCNFMEPLVTRV